MTLVFRDVKGQPLTHTEVDGNFRHLTSSHEGSGSITATAFIGDGSGLTNVQMAGIANVSSSGFISGSDLFLAEDANIAGNLTASNLLLTETDSNLTVATVSASGNIIASNVFASGNITGSNLLLTSADSKLTVSEITASNLRLTGNADIVGNITLGGNLTGGDSNSDSVTFNADITSRLRPNTDDTYDLGTESLRWQDIHGTAVNAEVLAHNKITASGTSTLAAGQNGIWIGPFSISGTVDIGLGSNFVLTSFNRMNEIDLINVSDY